MSNKPLSIMDHKKSAGDDMQYLIQPRGPGKSWVFRMVTPPDLVGTPNPWDGKPLGKEVKKGLGTRHPTEARKLRDIALGDMRRLAAGQTDDAAFSLPSAMEWREDIASARKNNSDPRAAEGMELVLSDKLEAAESRGLPRSQLKQFSRVATGKGFPLELARTQFVAERQPNNQRGFKPLAVTTVLNLETAVKHLRAFLSDNDMTACLEDVTPDLAYKFRYDFMPSISSKRSPEGMAAKTADKYLALLRPLWGWARERGLTAKSYRNPWIFDRIVARADAGPKKKRDDYQPEEVVKLLRASTPGSRGGDVIRLAVATGCRADEIASLSIRAVRSDGSGFDIAHGKTVNALRFVPVVGEAKALLKVRVAAHSGTGRLFPEWPIRPSTGKCYAVSQWFTHFRRRVLGVETDKRLALHSTRHTWMTAARRAKIPEADINELGGWAGRKTTSSPYDHGLLDTQLIEMQEKVWAWLKSSGYLEGF